MGPMDQATALFASLVIEMAAASALLHFLQWGRPWRGALAACLATLVSHPLVWLVFPETALHLGYWAALAIIEGSVVLGEASAYRLLVPIGRRRALAVSFSANAASTASGLLYYALTG